MISEDIINKNRLFPKFQLIPILRLQVLHDYVYWHCSIDYCVKLSLVDETLCQKWFSFHKEMISALFLWGNVLLRGELQIDANNSNFKNFESAMYMKSGSMPLISYILIWLLMSRLISVEVVWISINHLNQFKLLSWQFINFIPQNVTLFIV